MQPLTKNNNIQTTNKQTKTNECTENKKNDVSKQRQSTNKTRET